MAEHILDIIARGHSVSLYPPGTHCRLGYTRRSFLAVAAGPFRTEAIPGETFRSASAEGSSPQEAVARLHETLCDAKTEQRQQPTERALGS